MRWIWSNECAKGAGRRGIQDDARSRRPRPRSWRAASKHRGRANEPPGHLRALIATWLWSTVCSDLPVPAHLLPVLPSEAPPLSPSVSALRHARVDGRRMGLRLRGGVVATSISITTTTSSAPAGVSEESEVLAASEVSVVVSEALAESGVSAALAVSAVTRRAMAASVGLAVSAAREVWGGAGVPEAPAGPWRRRGVGQPWGSRRCGRWAGPARPGGIASPKGGAGGGVSNWQHSPQHRGGAPYADRATADRFGGNARGASQSSRAASAQQQIGRQGGNLYVEQRRRLEWPR